MRADFAFYAGEYNGTLPLDDFNRLSVRAEYELNRLTFGRADAEVIECKLAFCAIVDELNTLEDGDIVSESNDGVSRSYSVTRSKSQRIHDAAMVYLSGTNLCFAGV